MTHQGKNAKISEVSKDRLWRDYVSREENHQTYWAVEAQYVKGSLSPEKKNILRNVDIMRDFDATVLLGTTQMQRQASEPSSPTNTQRNKHYNSTNTFKTSSDPNAPSNLLLRQLQMTAAENTQAEEKTLEQLQNYKNNYSSRANLKYKARVAMMSSGENSKSNNNVAEEIEEAAVGSKKRSEKNNNNIPTPLSPNAFAGSYTAGSLTLSPTDSKKIVVSPYHTMNETIMTARGTGGSLSPLSTTRSSGVSPYNSSSPANVQKERTLNNSYCSHYANKDIGIHHYKYNAPARSGGDVQGQPSIGGDVNSEQQHAAHSTFGALGGSPLSSLNNTASSPQRPHGLPPLSLHKAQSPANNTAHLSSQTLSPLCSSRVYQHELELESSIVSPKRSYVEHGLLTPKMGVRIASATGRRGYGQRIASSHEEAYAMRPPVELNERSQHGYRKWN